MQYDLNLTANGAQQIDVAGSYFKYAKGLGPIRVQVDGGGYVDLLPGQGMQGLKFSRLMVKDTSGATNTGALVAGEGQFTDARISGTVDVVDGGKSRTLAGMAFSAWLAGGGVAGQFTEVQISNPAGSGKNIIIEAIAVASNTATGFQVMAGCADVGGATLAGVSKNLTSGALVNSSAVLKAGSVAAQSGSTIYLINAAVSTMATWKPVEPIVLGPGGILTVLGQGTQKDVSASFEWYEALIVNG